MEERSRTYSAGWSSPSRMNKTPQIATVKPVSKSLSEDDLIKAMNDKYSPLVFSRLKVEDISVLKKDNIIGELEKCLEELEEKNGATQHLSEVYQQVEHERNELMDELDVAFQDLQNYMHRQKEIEDQKEELFKDREELQRENEYLKAVLSGRNEIYATKAEEQNKHLTTRVKELESKNTQLVDEINDLYEDRQTLITSLLNLKSEIVDDVIKKRSRSSSVTSRESLENRDLLDGSMLDKRLTDLESHQAYGDLQKKYADLQLEYSDMQILVESLKREFSEQEKASGIMSRENVTQSKEYLKLLEDRNEKNLAMSKLNLEKRTLQRQLDHARDGNRMCSGKLTLLTDENKNLKAKIVELESIIEENEQHMEWKLKEALSEYAEELNHKESECDQLQEELARLRSQCHQKGSRLNNKELDTTTAHASHNEETSNSKNKDVKDSKEANEEHLKKLPERNLSENIELNLKSILKEVQDELDIKKSECEKITESHNMVKKQLKDLEDLNQEIICSRDDLNVTCTTLQGEVHEERARCRTLQNTAKQLEEEIRTLKRKKNNEYKQTKISNDDQRLQKDLEAVSTEKVKLDKKCVEFQKTNRALTDQLNEWKNEKRSLIENIKNLENSLSTEKFTKEKLTATVTGLQEQLREKHTECNKICDEKVNVEKRLGSLHICHDELQTQTSISNELKLENEKLRNHIATIQQNCHNLEQAIKNEKQQVHQLSEKNITMKKECDKLLRMNDELRVNGSQLKNELDCVVSQKNELKCEKDRIENKYKENEKQNQKLKSELHEVQSKSLKIQNELKGRISKLEIEQTNSKSQRIEELENLVSDLKLKCKQLQSKLQSQGQTVNVIPESNVTNTNMERLAPDNKKTFDLPTKEEKAIEKSVDHKTSEREKYSALLVKYDNLCIQYDNLCSQHKKINANFDANLKDTKNLSEQVRQLQSTLSQCQVNIDKTSKENTMLKSKISKCENESITGRNHVDEKSSEETAKLRIENKALKEEFKKLHIELEHLQANQKKVQKDYQYILQSHKEEAQAELLAKQRLIENERDTIKIKYDHLRVEYEKYEKEKSHYKLTVDSLREENKKLHGQAQKHKLMSNSTQDLMIKRLQSDNDVLEEKFVTLQTTMKNLMLENKGLLDRIKRTDDNTATTIRSLRASKSELHLQLERLKHENQKLRCIEKSSNNNVIRTSASNPSISQLEWNETDVPAAEKLRHLQFKTSQLEQDKKEYGKKLQESEALLYGLQQALAKANDLAMQKAFDGSKVKKTLEKKIEKLYNDNTELRRKLYFSKKDDESRLDDTTPTGLFPISPILERQKNDKVALLSRKASLPVKALGNKDLSSRVVPYAFPSGGNVFTYEDGRLSYDGDTSPLAPLSPRLAQSQRMENELSRQLRELLDITDGLANVNEDIRQEVDLPEESSVLPSDPLRFQSSSSETQIEIKEEDNETSSPGDIDELLNSLTNMAEELEREEKKKKSYEHWV